MPKPTSNDELVKRHSELRNTLIQKHAALAAQKIVKLKKLSAEEVTRVIAEEFKSSPI